MILTLPMKRLDPSPREALFRAVTISLLAVLLPVLTSCAPPPAAESPGWSDRRAPVASRLPWSDLDLPPPPDPVLLDEIREALDFRQREDFDRFLDAVEPGELIEHATVTQLGVDKGVYDIDALFVFGDELFEYEFRPENGLGNALERSETIRAGPRPLPNLRRVHDGEFGGPDSHSCAACHSKGGNDGAGNTTQNAYLRGDGDGTLAADVRNPPHLLGLGPVEALAIEMSAELQSQRDGAVAAARASGKVVRAALESKGVRFGTVTAHPDGTWDASAVEGVDPDLVIRPFGWKGHQATLRAMAEESFRIHLGIVSVHDQNRARDAGGVAPLLGDGVWYDIDRDGRMLEVDEGMLTSMVAYLAQLEAPVIRPPRPAALLDAFARGESAFEEVVCAECHRAVLELQSPVIEIRARGAEHAGKEPIRVNVARDGDHPKIEPQNVIGTAYNVRLFSDLKRHDMGPELATPGDQNGIPATVFITRSLWGLAFTAPYLHDGRAPALDDAIRLHGGEAAAARDRYLALESGERAALRIFLLSLTREPELFIP